VLDVFCSSTPLDAGDLLFDRKNTFAKMCGNIFDLTPFIPLTHQRLLSCRWFAHRTSLFCLNAVVARIAIKEKSQVEAGSDTSTQLSNRCRTSLYRIVFGKPNSHDESIVFLMAGSRDAAHRRATKALAILFDIEEVDVYVFNLASFVDLVDLVDSGVSDDEDVRIFEIGWKGSDVSVWAEHPLFLTDDASLLGKWAELYADVAQRAAMEIIGKARS
jgi:hypothetical protein